MTITCQQCGRTRSPNVGPGGRMPRGFNTCPECGHTNVSGYQSTAAHLDAALEHLRAIGHAHEADEPTRRHIEFAAAHLREAWIADDGQNAATPEQTHHAVAGFFRLQDKLTNQPTP